MTHGIGEPGYKTIAAWVSMGAAGTNHIFWIAPNPFTGSLLHPQ